jgi:hypothetical protein
MPDEFLAERQRLGMKKNVNHADQTTPDAA